MALDGGGTAGVPPPIPSPSKLTTPNQCLSLLVPLAHSEAPLPRPALRAPPGRRGGGAVAVRPSVRLCVRTCALLHPAARRAPGDTEAERGQGSDRHDPREPGVSGPRLDHGRAQ